MTKNRVAATTPTETLDNIAGVIDRFAEVVGLHRFAVYVFDYGAPTGFRIAMKHPDRITAIISQNGNAYEEGLSDGWNPIRADWQESSQANRDALRAFLAPEATGSQYTHGVTDEGTVTSWLPESTRRTAHVQVVSVQAAQAWRRDYPAART
jgi:pimeloyl-ACP methyl ester carboxylesterase